ncbi:15991_t:CDS:2 [Funneliformis mosseae]|uniref:15991_t:CDS:1 n=1 Tax=Funneliformis mosseae TaxID=27381 RepID=A0A9N8VXJ7_FUNMO|nr:15991_t:CDS:2 [Funneliformis mosseae]
MSLNIGYFFNNVDISVQIDDPPSQQPTLVTLNRKDNLSNIHEEDWVLNKILDHDTLYLTKNSNPDWKFLNELRKLDYGRIINFNGIKTAKRRAFEMKECKITEFGAEGCQKGNIEFNSNEDWMMKTNLIFTSNINVENLVKFGITVGKSQNKKLKFETNSTYRYTEYGKASLEFSKYLEPTREFIDAVKDAINSGDAEEFKQITEEFGQFIPNEVILGGRAYYEGHKVLKEQTEENAINGTIDVNAGPSENKIGNEVMVSNGMTKYRQQECAKLIGGPQPDNLENFDEAAWAKSLKDFRQWDCIEFKDPISIFQLLDKTLHNQVIKFLGKRIHYSKIEDYSCTFEKLGEPFMYELSNIPSHISKIMQNQDADCDLFATVIDAEGVKKDTFNCQILSPTKGKPSLIIHCIQEDFKKRDCKLKIGWMVIGYYTDLNFILTDFDVQLNIIKKNFNVTSNTQPMQNRALLDLEYNSFIRKSPCIGIPVLKKLDSTNNSLVIGHHFFNVQEESKIGSYTYSCCLQKKIYVDLPEFTFNILVISNYPDTEAYGISPFERQKILSKAREIFNNRIIRSNSSTKLKPKYVSLYITGENNYCPIFLKQKANKVKYKPIKYTICNNVSCICKNESVKENLKYSYFDPKPG